MRRLSFRLALLFTLAVVCVVPASAQRIAGDISGTLTDENGAVVPGAAVTGTCTATGLVRSTVSADAGAYRLVDLPICVYKVTVTMQGFKTVNREVQVTVSTVTKADFRLSLGERAEEVTVEGVAAAIEYSDKLNNTIDADRIKDMPINGRDFNALLGVVPGVQRTPGGGFLSINITGQRTTANNYMVDGISNNDRYYGGIALGEAGITGTAATIIPPDAIAEFTVQQTPGVEYGVKGGAAINVVMKSGTNDFHGSAHYFRGDDWMDANNYFTEKAGGEKPPFKNQQFGGTFGGPLVKDRTFFFGYYEAQRLEIGNPSRVFVPRPSEIAEARARIAAAGLTTNAAGEALLKYYPTDPSGEITQASPGTASSDSFFLKLDHKLNDKNQLSLRGTYGKGTQSAPSSSLEISPPSPSPPDMFNSITEPNVELVGLTWTSTMASNKILETRVGFNRFSQTIGVNNKIDPKSLGIDTGPLDPLDFGVPAVYYVGNFGYIGGILGYPLTTEPNANLDVSSTFTWLKGKHTLKFGGNYQHATTYSVRNRARTELDFTGGTFDNVDSLTALLLGKSDDALRTFGSTVRHLRQDSFGGYVSDEWKVSPRFTVNLGVRYDVSMPLGEKDDLAANFFPERGLVTVGQGIDKLYNTDSNNIGPRVGFAWDPAGDGKTAIRGGYSLTYDVSNFAAIHAPYSINGARVGAFTQKTQGVFGVVLNGGLSVLPDDPSATCVDPVTGVGDYVCVVPGGGSIYGASPTGQPPFNAFSVTPDLQTPMFHIFHLSFQREVFKRNTMTVSYVGNRGKDMLMVHDLNAPPIGTDYTDPQPNRPFATQYPDLKHIVQLNNDGKMWYDSLQFSWRQRDWHGINTQYNLTWSHCLDYNSVNRGGGGQAGQYQNPYDPAGNKGNCDYDVPLNFNVGGNYSIPDFGMGELGKGWEFSTIFTALSGRPYTATVNRDRSGQNFDNVRADCNGTVQYNPQDPDHYIANPDVFSVPANGAVGTCGRNTIRGPGLAQWDLALVKTTRVGGNAKLQLRVEGFNILNRANFGPPNVNVRSGSFGTLSQTADVFALNPIISQGGPRAFQFALKLLF